MTTQQITYMITLAEEKSFSKAAKRLFVTQPSLSQFIKNLESQMDTVLFDRSTSPIQLTPSGEAYYESAIQIQAAERELTNKISDLSTLKTGTLTIGTTSFRASCMLPKSIAAFHLKYPGIHLNIKTSLLPELHNALSRGEIDICIESNSFNPQQFFIETLATETYYLATPEHHPFNFGKEDFQLSYEDIAKDTDRLYQTKSLDLVTCKDETFVFLQPNHSVHNKSIALCKAAGIVPNIFMYASQIETTFHWVLSGIAFSFIPDTMIRFGNYSKHPIYYKIMKSKSITNQTPSAITSAEEEIVIAFKKNRYLPNVAKEYILILKQLIGQGTWQSNT